MGHHRVQTHTLEDQRAAASRGLVAGTRVRVDKEEVDDHQLEGHFVYTVARLSCKV